MIKTNKSNSFLHFDEDIIILHPVNSYHMVTQYMIGMALSAGNDKPVLVPWINQTTTDSNNTGKNTITA